MRVEIKDPILCSTGEHNGHVIVEADTTQEIDWLLERVRKHKAIMKRQEREGERERGIG